MSPIDSRQQALRALADGQFDLAIIGGGITGCGIARDAALRGLKVALIEKLDFAAGTSSKSSKLVHGGLRYLEQGELKLVFESVNERNLLMHRARHLVRPMPFLVTNFKGDRRWLVTLDLGLWIYEALCLFRAYKLHRTYGGKKTLQLEPGLRSERLNGGILYYDCVTDDARLTLENALDARALGAVVLNHARAGELLRDGQRVVGLKVHDELSATGPVDVRATVVINATGPWTDEVRALMGEQPLLKPTKGVHVVLDSARLPVRNSMMMLSPRDGRAVFAIPWGEGRSVIGTTDTFFDGRADEVFADRADAEYLLEVGNHYFPAAKLQPSDILSTWAGLRPLLRPPDATTGASQVSREHLTVEQPGFITIAGGKLTTYRRMAAEVLDLALQQLGKQLPCTTGARPLPGAAGLDSDDDLSKLTAELVHTGVRAPLAEQLTLTYGQRAKAVAARLTADPATLTPLDPELPYVLAQVDEAVEHEFAATLDDVLTRRIPLLLRGRDQGVGIAELVATRMAGKLGWSPEHRATELKRWRAVVATSQRFRQ